MMMMRMMRILTGIHIKPLTTAHDVVDLPLGVEPADDTLAVRADHVSWFKILSARDRRADNGQTTRDNVPHLLI